MGKSTAAAPSAIAAIKNRELNPAMIQAWIEQAQVENDGSIAFREGIAFLQSLLVFVDPRRDGIASELSEPIQSRDVDTVSLGESQ